MALYLVTTLADEAFDGGETAGTPDGAGLSLREALALANADPDTADQITFASGLTGGTLTLTQGELVISGNTALDADLDDDTAFDITIDADGASRAIRVTNDRVDSEMSVDIDGLRITGGYAVNATTGIDSGGSALLVETALQIPIDRAGGGALGIDGGSVALDNVAIADNVGNGIAALGDLGRQAA
jgi:hypothetical protein